jgi:hypothetical protein
MSAVDMMSLALRFTKPGDEVVMVKNSSNIVSIDLIEGDEGRLPMDPSKNTVSAVVINYLKHIGVYQGVGIKPVQEDAVWQRTGFKCGKCRCRTGGHK